MLNSTSYLLAKYRLLKRKTLIERVKFRNRYSRESVLGQKDVILSLTTFGPRIHSAALAIESIGQCIDRPKKIILWLDHSFRSGQLPTSICRLVSRGLDIRYVEDIRSHKKYFFALDESLSRGYPIVTIDDDFVYPPWFLENLLKIAQENANSVACYRAREMSFLSSGEFAPYEQWAFADTQTPSERLFFTSGGGAYLPLGLIGALQAAGDSFLETCPFADDIWLNYHALRARIGKRLVLDRSTDFTPIVITELDTLWSVNASGGNDAQLRTTFDPATLATLIHTK